MRWLSCLDSIDKQDWSKLECGKSAKHCQAQRNFVDVVVVSAIAKRLASVYRQYYTDSRLSHILELG